MARNDEDGFRKLRIAAGENSVDIFHMHGLVVGARACGIEFVDRNLQSCRLRFWRFHSSAPRCDRGRNPRRAWDRSMKRANCASRKRRVARSGCASQLRPRPGARSHPRAAASAWRAGFASAGSDGSRCARSADELTNATTNVMATTAKLRADFRLVILSSRARPAPS